jgi:G3E family GTPase
MKILLISGFLGAGKTTFIKELVKRTGTQPVIMENEYGDNNIDSKELQQSVPKEKEIKILEFMEGCVCCTMKDSFVNSVLTVFSSLNPEYLIIEPTGVGRLSNILTNLKPILHGDISLLKPAVVLSPQSYAQNMKEWPELYRDQVANAQRVIFSKCEHESPEVIKAATEEIRKINPTAEILGGHYSSMDDDWWNSLLDIEGTEKEIEATEGADSFSQVTITEGRISNVAELVMMLEDCIHGEFGHVARAKGTILVGNEMVKFDLADRLYIMTGTEEGEGQCVFIGKNLDQKNIKRRLMTGEGESRLRSDRIAAHFQKT